MSNDRKDAFKAFYNELKKIAETKPEAGSSDIEVKSLKSLVEGLQMKDNPIVANVLKQLNEILEGFRKGPYVVQVKTLVLLASQVYSQLED